MTGSHADARCTYPSCSLPPWSLSHGQHCILHDFQADKDLKEFAKTLSRLSTLVPEMRAPILQGILAPPGATLSDLSAVEATVRVEASGSLHLVSCRLAELDVQVRAGEPIRITCSRCDIARIRIGFYVASLVEISFNSGSCEDFVLDNFDESSPARKTTLEVVSSRIGNFRHYGLETALDAASWEGCELGGKSPDPFAMIGKMSFSGCRLLGSFAASGSDAALEFEKATLSGEFDFWFQPVRAERCVFEGLIQRMDFSRARLEGSSFQNVRLLEARWPGAFQVQAEGLEWREHIHRQLKVAYANQGEADVAAELHMESMRTRRIRVQRDTVRNVWGLARELRQRVVHRAWYRDPVFRSAAPGTSVKIGNLTVWKPDPLGQLRRLRKVRLLAWLWVQEVLYGYGVRPGRLSLWAGGLLFGCAILDWLLIRLGLGDVKYGGTSLPLEGFQALGSLVYFSGVTMATVGYGDFVPTGWVRGVAVGEALGGVFLMALFVVTFVRKYAT